MPILIAGCCIVLITGCTNANSSPSLVQTVKVTADQYWKCTFIEAIPRDQITVIYKEGAIDGTIWKGDGQNAIPASVRLGPSGKLTTRGSNKSLDLKEFSVPKAETSQPLGALMLRVGRRVFFCGEKVQLSVPDGASGTLWLGINLPDDVNIRRHFFGSYIAEVSVEKHH